MIDFFKFFGPTYFSQHLIYVLTLKATNRLISSFRRMMAGTASIIIGELELGIFLIPFYVLTLVLMVREIGHMLSVFLSDKVGIVRLSVDVKHLWPFV